MIFLICHFIIASFCCAQLKYLYTFNIARHQLFMSFSIGSDLTNLLLHENRKLYQLVLWDKREIKKLMNCQLKCYFYFLENEVSFIICHFRSDLQTFNIGNLSGYIFHVIRSTMLREIRTIWIKKRPLYVTCEIRT